MPKYVVIGASAAGIGAVEAIRDIDPVGTMAIISEELCLAYSRPMISGFISGEATLQRMMCREDDFYRKNGVEALTRRRVTTVNFAEKYVTLDNEERVDYEKLLIATGGIPFVPKIEGADKDGVFTFTTISDAEQIGEKLENLKRVVVIGAGLIGISVTEALTKRGIEVTLVELQNNVLSLLLDANASEIIEEAMQKTGVKILTSQSVQKIVGRPENDQIVGGVVITKGDLIPCDAVIVAIGVMPRTELVAGSEVKLNRGIIVDNFMKTNVEDVYASGDVAETWDFNLGQNRLLPLWPLAMYQGKVAGYNMAGKKTEYAGGTNMSSLQYFGLPVVSIGITNPHDPTSLEILVKHKPEENMYKKIVLKDNIIVGIILINDIERAGVLFHLMKNRVNVRKFKQELLSETFSLALLPAFVRKPICLKCAL